MKNRIAILQPEVPHYREDFFRYLRRDTGITDLFVYNPEKRILSQGFCQSSDVVSHIPNVQIKGFLFYNPFTLLSRRYDTLVLMLHFAHITTWLLLLTKWLHRKKIILWGQGISVKRYLQEEKKPDWKLKWQMALADGVWIYMEKEAEQWSKIFPKKPIVALNNTLSGAGKMTGYKPQLSRDDLKRKYGIGQKTVLIFCARFENNYRRTDLLLEAIERLDSRVYGFIIIGAGRNKPDFSAYNNVYDFGALYDMEIKQELFYVADLYFQPGWVGLSIVEAMAYGKPVCTFARSEETKQCVEYSYIKDGVNGLVFSDMDDCVNRISMLTTKDISVLGNNARTLVKNSLTPENMAKNGLKIIKTI
jgi:glycosyltransferase, group 1 family